MNTRNLLLLPTLIAGFGLMLTGRVTAQTFTVLHSFTATNGPALTNSDGAGPQAGLIMSGNTLYGMATFGGSSGNGTIFRISLPAPQLTITPSGTNVILFWPTSNGGFDYSGYRLQITADLGAAAGWSTFNLPTPPVVVNGQYVVTIANNIGSQHFFRLSQ